jgi:Polymerase beta, Nucleotidyltransferase
MAQIVSVDEIGKRFGVNTPRRQFLFRQMQRVVTQLLSTGSVKQIFIFGSFVTGKAVPNDIDLFVVMSEGFSTEYLRGRILDVFRHDICRIRYHADVFWVTEAVGADQINDVLNVFSRDRDGRDQLIFEVTP